MRWIVTIGFCLNTFVFSFAQQRELERRIPTIGDTLYYATDHLAGDVDLLTSGTDRQWDYSGLMSAFIRKRSVDPVASDLMPGKLKTANLKMMDMDGLYSYFRHTEGGMELIGREFAFGGNIILRAWYEVSVPYPGKITYRDGSIGDYVIVSESKPERFFHELGLKGKYGADSMRLKFAVHENVSYDAFGTLKLPVGIYDVIREKVAITSNPVLEMKRDGSWRVVPITGNRPDWLQPRASRHYAMWTEGYPEPVALIRLSEDGRPSRIHYHAPKWSGKLIEKLPTDMDVIAYPNPSFGPVRFDFYNLPDGRYRLEIFNILGVKLMQEDLMVFGSATIQLDLSELKKGTYLYRLVDSEKNAIRSKRLVIISP